MCVVSSTLERLSTRDREDIEEVQKQLPLNVDYNKTSWKTRKCTSGNQKERMWSKRK